MSTQPAETAEERLEGIRRVALALRDSGDTWVWQMSLAIEQLCMGTVTVAQALAQVDN